MQDQERRTLELNGRLYFKPEEITLLPTAGPRSRQAVATIRSAITRGQYAAVGPAAYETWYWIGAAVPLGVRTGGAVVEAAQSRRSEAAILRAAGAVDGADRLEREAIDIEAEATTRRRGRPPDPRRGFGGFGGFVLALRNGGMSIGDIVQLHYDSLHATWYPRAPLTEAMLDENGWLRDNAADVRMGRSARGRFAKVLDVAASRERRRQGQAKRR